ncbi:MAG: hypothetical protein ACXAC5_00265 [Promethearchaeota archaeon]|jgi:hypothetical protein
MSTRIASFFATYTTSIHVGPENKDNEEIHRVTIEETGTSEHIGVYHWDFGYIDDTYSTIVSELDTASIVNMQLSFKYNNNQDGLKLSIMKYGTGDPRIQSATAILAQIGSTELATADILSTNVTGITLTLDDEDNLYYESQLNVVAREGITVTLHRHSDLDASDGSVELSGQNLVGGTSEWRLADPDEPIDPPLLIITYDIPVEAYPRLDMKYTTADPAVSQNTPVNSIGDYVATNDVYPSGDIKESISSTQTAVPIETADSLPTVVGLGSVGPEVFRYTVIDTTNHQLAGVVRGVAPLSAFPAGFDSFKNPERVYYLNDLNLLFDTRPSSGLIQYRCVAIINSDSGDDFNIQDAVIGIAQDATANVQLRIGIEFPKFDSRTGLAKDGARNTSPTLLVDTDFSDPDGFFDGAAIKFLDPVDYAVVDSYTSDGEFVLDRSVTNPDLAAGRSFVILPAPAQATPNDATTPTTNSGRFTGFKENVEGITIELLEHGTTMQENDLFYVWIRRTLASDVEETNDTGAVLVFRYRDI